MSQKIPTLLLQRFLPYRLSVLSNKISQSLADHYSTQFDLTNQEWRILAILGEGKPYSAAELAGRTAMDKVAISRAVKKLLDSNRLVKHQDTTDNRRFELSLSAEGLALYKQVAAIADQYEKELLATFSSQEIEEMDTILNKLDNAIEQLTAK